MYDIRFWMKFYELQKSLMKGEKFKRRKLFDTLESMRYKEQMIYNIETTNACNMRCIMCPRTTMMKRKVETINKETFIKVVDQIRPWTKEEWNKWEEFLLNNYNISNNDISEDHFFLYIIPKVIQLHGYGDPLLDKHMDEYVKILREKGFGSYFSCNPANIDIAKTVKMMDNGLDYLKYSFESTDDEDFKAIRGKAANFTEAYSKTLKVLDIKRKNGYKTTIVICMINLSRHGQLDEYRKLEKAFEGEDVYIYLKSEDQQWYRKDYHGTTFVHWLELCKHPWMSMTIKSDGKVVMCMEDFNNEIILGDAKNESLTSIWNGKKYHQFRKDHLNLTPNIKCTEACDMKLVGNMNLLGGKLTGDMRLAGEGFLGEENREYQKV